MYKVENIRKVFLNGELVKTFDVRELQDRAWVFVGSYVASAKTANKNLLKTVEDRLNGY